MSEECFKPYWALFGVTGTHFSRLGLICWLPELTLGAPGLTFGLSGLSLALLGLTLRVSWEHLGGSGPHFGVFGGAKAIIFQKYS